MAVAVLKMVLVALVVAGLIFRTKETIGLLLLFGAWALFNAFPAVCIGVGGVAVLVVFFRWILKKKDPPEAEQLSLPLSDAPDS